MTTHDVKPVLILGAGINGCAVARELILNGIPVTIVDIADVASGATSRSSRLIHGGLRYLEYSDLSLVRESLQERALLLKLAPQFVRPIRLYIPVSNRLGGLWRSIIRFFRLESSWLGRSSRQPKSGRGLWLVRLGLWLYSRFSRQDPLEKVSIHETHQQDIPQVDPQSFRWLCGYSDAQILYPERFTLALLEDARRSACERDIEFRVFTYHSANFDGNTVVVEPIDTEELERHQPTTKAAVRFQPSVIINATGAWGDWTLQKLKVSSPRLFGGTKGSHFFTTNLILRENISEAGLYVEANDGRLVFILPLTDGVLVGTTDERFDLTPDQAIATREELDYLIGMVNQVVPQAELTDADISMHYSGVRPLPYTDEETAAAIPRGHSIEHGEHNGLPVLTLVGGKLTTCRELAEQTASSVLQSLNREQTASTRDRLIPGAEDYPCDSRDLEDNYERLATEFNLTIEQTRATWMLVGNRLHEFVAPADSSNKTIPGTDLPVTFVQHVIDQEWVTTLEDLIERRLMLLYAEELSIESLRALADCLVDAGHLESSEIDSTIDRTISRLARVYGKQVGDRRAVTTETFPDSNNSTGNAVIDSFRDS